MIGWEIEAVCAGVSPVEVNGKEAAAGQKLQFREKAVVKIMEFVLTLEDAQEQGPQRGGGGATQ